MDECRAGRACIRLLYETAVKAHVFGVPQTEAFWPLVPQSTLEHGKELELLKGK